MKIYSRKGGSGKTGTLRQQFNYYKRQLRNRLIYEKSFKEARGLGTIEEDINTLFQRFDYKDIYEKGLTRKIGSQTVRFFGEEAIRIQISSFRKRASKTFQVQAFIKNYINSMKKNNFTEDDIQEVEKLLNSISSDRLTLIIDKDILPSIQYLYAQAISTGEIMEDIRDAIKKGVSKEELNIVKERTKELIKINKMKDKIFGR